MKNLLILFLMTLLTHSLADEKRNRKLLYDPNQPNPTNPFFGTTKKFFQKFDDLQKQMEERMQQFFNQKDLNHKFATRSGHSIDIIEREDSKFKYVDILLEKSQRNSLDINIEGGIIQVTGVEKKEIKSGNRVSYFESSFSNSVLVPEGVIKDKPRFESTDEKIIIIFTREEAR